MNLLDYPVLSQFGREVCASSELLPFGDRHCFAGFHVDCGAKSEYSQRVTAYARLEGI